MAHGAAVRPRLVRWGVRAGALAAVLALILGSSLYGAPIVRAAEVSPPPYLLCRYNVSTLDLDDPYQVVYISCQYYNTGETVDNLVFWANGDPFGPTGSGLMYQFTWPPTSTTVNEGGLYRGTYQKSPMSGKAFYPELVTTYGCQFSTTNQSGTSWNSCAIEYVGVAASYPSYPTSWFSGGGDGNPNGDVADPNAVCSRVLEIYPDGQSVGRFKTGNTLDPNAVDTYAWDFGDSSGMSTDRRPVYTYDLGTMPEGGWTAEVTVTRTPNANHAFSSDGTTTPKTAECALRVDFYNPSESNPEDMDSTEDDSECPTGWGWLNPLAIVDILKCLFVPTENLGDSWDEFYGTASENWPSGPLTFAAGTVNDHLSEFNEGLDPPLPGTETDCPLDVSIDFTPGEANDNVDIPLIPGAEQPGAGTGADCAGSSEALISFANGTRTLLTFAVVLGFGIALFRIVSSAFGGGESGGSSDGD